MPNAVPARVNGQASNTAPAMREKITFRQGEPVTVTLEHEPHQAKETPGKWGNQYRYFLANNHIAFVDPDLHQALCETASAGEPITITKQPGGQWHINTAAIAPPAPAPTQPLPAPNAGGPPELLLHAGELQAALKLAIDALAVAVDYARLHHLHIEHGPDWGDVRALAATLVINAKKGGPK
jgi:hypothetical protein